MAPSSWGPATSLWLRWTLNQFMFTVNGYYNLFRSIRYTQRQENLNKEAVDRYLLDWIEARM